MLQDLEQQVKRIATDWLRQLREIADSSAAENPAQRSAAVARAMDEHLNQLADTNVWGTDNRISSGHVWQIVGPILRQGSLQLHAREKPLGYAGDFRLLERICSNDRRGSGLSRAFDEYFQQHAAPKAVRNRATLLAETLHEFVGGRADTIHIASFGSGPAFELRLLCERLPADQRQRLQLTLLDIDPHAIEFATSRLRRLLTSDQIQSQRVNLARLPQLRDRDTLLPRADFIYASGFFDYLRHGEAVTTIRYLWQRINRLGKLIVFNFCQQNPSRAYMEWIANWYLIYRSDEEMRRLASDSQLPAASWTTNIEPAGVNRFLTATKT